MAGNPTNAAVWGGADVLVGAVTATIPVGNAAFPMRRSVVVGTTNADATVTAASGTFSASDVGQSISGTGIPAAATIITFTSSTSVEISANATATGAPTAEIGATSG